MRPQGRGGVGRQGEGGRARAVSLSLPLSCRDHTWTQSLNGPGQLLSQEMVARRDGWAPDVQQYGRGDRGQAGECRGTGASPRGRIPGWTVGRVDSRQVLGSPALSASGTTTIQSLLGQSPAGLGGSQGKLVSWPWLDLV